MNINKTRYHEGKKYQGRQVVSSYHNQGSMLRGGKEAAAARALMDGGLKILGIGD